VELSTTTSTTVGQPEVWVMPDAPKKKERMP